MAKKRKSKKQSAEVFTFGDPVPVRDQRDILNYLESWWQGKWYEPPISMKGLAQSYGVSPHHSSCIQVKKNILVSLFEPHPLLSKAEFTKWTQDYLVFGNGYMERVPNKLGRSLRLKNALAKYTRRGREEDQFFFLRGGYEPHEFKDGSVFHLVEPDINQEIYGVPEYLSGLNSAWLNESATLFRRKYYENGSHAGYILYMTDAAKKEEYVDDLRASLKESKGPGNFRNLFMYAPNGKKDGIQVIPLAEVQAKDEFFNMKNVTRDDIMAAHRVPPQIMGIIPQNTAGFGNAKEAAEVFNINEIIPLQERFKELNEWIGEEVVKFREYELAQQVPAAN